MRGTLMDSRKSSACPRLGRMTALFESEPEDRRLELARGLRRAGKGLLDLLFPPLCVSCRAPVSRAHSLCAACWESISFLDGPACACCGYPFDFDPGEG